MSDLMPLRSGYFHKMQNKQIRQGDVFLHPIAEAPDGERASRQNGVLAYGEVTGHKHALADRTAAEVYEVEGKLYLSVTAAGGVSIHHEEHDDVQVPPGNYEVRIQREYSPEEVRNVAD